MERTPELEETLSEITEELVRFMYGWAHECGGMGCTNEGLWTCLDCDQGNSLACVQYNTCLINIDSNSVWCTEHLRNRHELPFQRLHIVQTRSQNELNIFRHSPAPWSHVLQLENALCQDCPHVSVESNTMFVRATGAVSMTIRRASCQSMMASMLSLGYFPATPVIMSMLTGT